MPEAGGKTGRQPRLFVGHGRCAKITRQTPGPSSFFLFAALPYGRSVP
jgi:hypothetical protein